MRNNSLALLTDFYELTMMQGYYFEAPAQQTVFEMFYRHQPYDGGYAVFAGLDPLLDEIEKIKFYPEDLEYLKSQNIFKDEFLDYLKTFSFKGDIFSVKEGSVVFPNEPLIRVKGTFMETQLIESILLNFINFQSLIATKSARIVDISGSTPILEFGLRRAQGVDGSISASRASYIGGVAATSNVLAGKTYGIPVSGTMAHSWVMGADNELEAFRKYAELYPEKCVLLVDTFDTLKSGLPNAVKVFQNMKKNKTSQKAIRIDSGDLEYLSKQARKFLDEKGLHDVKIFVSSDVDEWIIRQLKNTYSPIDAFGVGTKLIAGGIAPALPGVYKIVSIETNGQMEPCIKISNQSEKITNPGSKNIYRFYNKNGSMLADLIYLEEETAKLEKSIEKKEPVKFNHPSTDYEFFSLDSYSHAEKMLNQVMKDGNKIGEKNSLCEIREHRDKSMKSLDETYRRLLNPHVYKVSLSSELKKLKTDLINRFRN